MTIRWYSTASELTGSADGAFKGARFQLILGYKDVEHGRPRFKRSEFAVCGTTESAVEQHAIRMCELILANTEAVEMKLNKIMGHYRKDVSMPIVPSNRRLMGVLGVSPDPDTVEAVNVKLFVPNWTGSIAQLEALADEGTYDTTETAQIGYIRWTDQDQTHLEAYKCPEVRGTSISDVTYLRNEHLVSQNSADGVADGVLGADM